MQFKEVGFDPLQEYTKQQAVGIRVITLKDKKQVSFLTTNYPCSPNEGGTTKRYVKGRQKRIEIPCPAVQKDYVENFNAVDRNDRDKADYSCSLKTNR